MTLLNTLYILGNKETFPIYQTMSDQTLCSPTLLPCNIVTTKNILCMSQVSQQQLHDIKTNLEGLQPRGGKGSEVGKVNLDTLQQDKFHKTIAQK
jgi:hypothetical protein